MGVSVTLPNLFRTANEDENGFDPSFVWLEKRFTVCTGATIVVSILTCIIVYANQTFMSTGKYIPPTMSDYETIQADPSLIGSPHCVCSQQVLPFGMDDGGFIANATFQLDAMCGIPGEGPVEVVAPSERFQSLDRQAPPGQDPIPPRYGCRGVVGVAHGWSYSYTPWAECAIVQGAVTNIVTALQDFCDTALNVHDRALQNFMKSFLTTEQLHTKTTLEKLVESELDKLALSNGVMFYSIWNNNRNDAMLIDRPNMTLAKLQNSLDESGFAAECQDFRAGSDTGVNLAAILEECASRGAWTGTCCNPPPDVEPGVGPCVEPEPYDLPCSADMVTLAGRMRETEFDSMSEALYAGLLAGMSSTSRSSRLNSRHGIGKPPPQPPSTTAAPGNASGAGAGAAASGTGAGAAGAGPPPQRRRLTDGSEGFAVQDSVDVMFERYFAGCNPYSCTYTYVTNRAKGVVLVISGMVGGIAAIGRNVGLAGVVAARWAVQRFGAGAGAAPVGGQKVVYETRLSPA